MGDLVLTTYDWVPPPPRGFVRDIRVRWALEEAKLPYRVESVSFKERGPEHLAHQPFGQVPWLTDGDISIFESGAIAAPRRAERGADVTSRSAKVTSIASWRSWGARKPWLCLILSKS